MKKNKLSIVFFGTPNYVVKIAEKLHSSFRNNRGEGGVIAIVTQPPKPSGRGNQIAYSEVDSWAHKKGIEKIYDLDQVPVADLGVVASYGRIIPKSVIDNFKYGVLNIHPSLLPKFRGASPVQSTVALGEKITGVTVIKMDDKMDHGPIVSSFKHVINIQTDSGELRDLLFAKSVDFIVDLIPNYINGKVALKDQNHKKATFTKLLTKSDGFIDPVLLNKLISCEAVDKNIALQLIKETKMAFTPESISRLISAMKPWPVAWTNVDINGKSKRLKLLESTVEDDCLKLTKVQLEGKGEVTWEKFCQGYPKVKFI